MSATKTGSPRYIAVVKGAREVTLVGDADYQYWAEQLVADNLVPIATNGRAEAILSAVQLKWMGVSFREFSVSIRVHDAADATIQGIYLVSAFSTSRLFTLFEKYHFHTPYRHSMIHIGHNDDWSFELFGGHHALIEARRHAVGEVELRDETWEFRIFLPSGRQTKKPSGRLFYAKLSGPTQIARFSVSLDALQWNPAIPCPVVQSLIDSQFTGSEWHVRSNATHARSKTYRRHTA